MSGLVIEEGQWAASSEVVGPRRGSLGGVLAGEGNERVGELGRESVERAGWWARCRLAGQPPVHGPRSQERWGRYAVTGRSAHCGNWDRTSRETSGALIGSSAMGPSLVAVAPDANECPARPPPVGPSAGAPQVHSELGPRAICVHLMGTMPHHVHSKPHCAKAAVHFLAIASGAPRRCAPRSELSKPGVIAAAPAATPRASGRQDEQRQAMLTARSLVWSSPVGHRAGADLWSWTVSRSAAPGSWARRFGAVLAGSMGGSVRFWWQGTQNCARPRRHPVKTAPNVAGGSVAGGRGGSVGWYRCGDGRLRPWAPAGSTEMTPQPMPASHRPVCQANMTRSTLVGYP